MIEEGRLWGRVSAQQIGIVEEEAFAVHGVVGVVCKVWSVGYWKVMVYWSVGCDSCCRRVTAEASHLQRVVFRKGELVEACGWPCVWGLSLWTILLLRH